MLSSPSGKLITQRLAPADGSAFIDYRAPAAGTYFIATKLVQTETELDYTLSAARR
jgi:hypothetical protein